MSRAFHSAFNKFTFHYRLCGVEGATLERRAISLSASVAPKHSTNTQMNTLDTTLKISKAFKEHRDKVLAASGNTRFAEKEQLEMIKFLVDLLVNDPDIASEGYGEYAVDDKPGTGIAPFVQAVSNASAFAQLLEKKGKIIRAKKGIGGAKSAMAD